MSNFNNFVKISNQLLCGYRQGLANRANTAVWNGLASYSRSAEEKLGIEKPKRPATAFFRFTAQIRPMLAAKNPGAGATEVMKLASKHWQQLDAQVKEKLTKEYEKDMEGYKLIRAKYEASLSEEQKEDIKKMKTAIETAKEKRKLKAEYKELGRPKRPMSSYLLFSVSEKDSFKGSIAEYQNKMAEKWHKLSPQEKEKWDAKALQLKENYKKAMSQWEEKMIRMGNIDYVRNKALMSDKKTKSNKAASA